MQSKNLNEQTQEILKIAEKHGVEQNFFFITTFKRYQVQLGILNNLEKTIKNDGVLSTNGKPHPAINDYNRTASSANKTVTTLMKIITTLRDKEDDYEEEDGLFLDMGE